MEFQREVFKIQKLDSDGYGEVGLESFIHTCTRDPIIRYRYTDIGIYCWLIYLIVVQLLLDCIFPGSHQWLGMERPDLIEAVKFLKIFCSPCICMWMQKYKMEETLRYIYILRIFQEKGACIFVGANFRICLLEAFNSFFNNVVGSLFEREAAGSNIFWSQLSKAGGNCLKQIWQVWQVEWLLLIAAPCLSCLCHCNFVFCICLCHFFFASIINLSCQTG